MSKDYIFRISRLQEKQIVVRHDSKEQAEKKLIDAYSTGKVTFNDNDTVQGSFEVEMEPDDQKWIDENGADKYERLTF